MDDLKTILNTLIRQTEEIGRQLPSIGDYVVGRLDAFNLILEYVETQTEE